MFKRLFSLICFLFICLVPVNLFALEDNYVIKSNGSVNSLYSKYIWDKSTWVISGTKTPSGYFCDGSTRQYWNYYKPPRSTGCDNKQKIGLEACGYWSSTKASNSNLQSNYTRLLCTQSGSRKVEEKNLIQNAYKTDNGSDAFCVNPGRAFSEQTYVKSEEYNVSDCKTSNNSYYCALASVFANYSNSDYLAKLTALRLISGAYNQGGGWWDSSEKSTYAADIYAKTAKEIMNGTFVIKSVATKTGILYDRDNTNGSFQEGVEIFKSVMNGFEIWAPSAKVVSKSYDGSQVTLNIETNFDGISTISNVTYNGYNVNYSAAECSNSSSKTCMTVTFNLDSSQVTNCKNKIRIFYDKIDSKAISSVYLYTASQNVGNQQMVVYDTSGETYVDVSICPSGGEDLKCKKVEKSDGTYIYYGLKGAIVDEATYKKECKNVCSNTGIDKNMPEDCNDGTIGTISDPSMCTILNNDKVKNNYELKNYDKQYCTVYCRESFEFHFMSKEKAIAGRYFYHNVTSYDNSKENLSTVIESTRQCASIIKYDDWEKAYDKVNKKLLNAYNQFKGWEAFYNSGAKDTDGNPTGDPNSTKVDNGCTGSKCTTGECTANGGITSASWGPTYWSVKLSGGGTRLARTSDLDMVVAETIDNAEKYTSITGSSGSLTLSVNYGSKSECSSCTTGQTCCDNKINAGTYTSMDQCDVNTCCISGSCASAVTVNTNIVSTTYRQAYQSYLDAINERDNLVAKIESCNFYYGSDLYGKVTKYAPKNTISIDYDENTKFGTDSDKNKTYDISIANELETGVRIGDFKYSDSSDWSTFCGEDCEGNLSNLSDKSYTKNLSYWDCDSDGSSCELKKQDFPTNKVVSIEIKRETRHYQKNNFYVQAFTGKVDTKAGKIGYWFYLNDNNKHLYPVSSVRKSGTYDIEVTYSSLGEQNSRNNKINVARGGYSCSYDVVNELTIYDCDDNYDDHTCKCLDGTDCSKNVDGQVGMGVYYRPISLNDVFPHSSYSPTVGGTINVNTRNIGENWTTAKAVQVVKEIQSSGDNLIIDKKPQYVVKLTPTIMKKIRSYNDNTTYLDNSIYKCDDNLICYSSFLDKDLKNIMGSSNYRILYSKDSSIKSDSLFYYINK